MSLKKTTRSIRAAAKFLEIGQKTCRVAVERGQIPSVLIGNRRRITVAVLEQIAAGRVAEVTSSVPNQ